MRFSFLASSVLVGSNHHFFAFTSAWTTQTPSTNVRRPPRHSFLKAAGADIEQPPFFAQIDDDEPNSSKDGPTLPPSNEGDIPWQSQSPRGKVNEIDFCIAPADVSLSRAYIRSSSINNSKSDSTTTTAADAAAAPVMLSLTRALNNASNRAVRRILLARSWPSAEALNLSLRLVTEAAAAAAAAAEKEANKTGPKCPVPRSILNVLTRRRRDAGASKRAADWSSSSSNNTNDSASTAAAGPKPRGGRTDQQYVADQIHNFQQRYGDLPGYPQAQDYLQAILSLATSGVEAPTVPAILQDGVYDESYKRVLSVLKTVGVVFETDPETKRRRIAGNLIDQDICLSMMDKIQLRHATTTTTATTVEDEQEDNDNEDTDDDDDDDEVKLTKEDLGGVLLSANEPTMTRQLNSLANIVERALLFGGDQELLVLAETLDADRAAFVERWYPRTGGLGVRDDDGGGTNNNNDNNKNDSSSAIHKDETRPGVQFLNCMIQLLRDCYTNGVVTDLEPPLPLLTSYANAYERLVASAVELGSGYLKPVPGDILTLPKPRTATEELGRFAVWESTFRQGSDTAATPYPDDMVGTWEVRDVIGGETIGVSKVVLADEGNVQVDEPLEGLRWRLDPGPTHLDTCTFQVLSGDGTILQYRGFIDRGARLEARFSKRSITIRGSVMFQMRDGSVDYYKDMLPINYRTGTTKFVMTKLDDKQ